MFPVNLALWAFPKSNWSHPSRLTVDPQRANEMAEDV